MESEIESGMREWRQGHRKATLREIEGELEARLSQLRVRVMEEMVGGSASVEWVAGAGPKCPECGEEMKRRGKAKRELTNGDGKQIVLEREYASCPACGVGFFPPGPGIGVGAGSVYPESV